jgi:F-type H+-transporting ATPase subunit b
MVIFPIGHGFGINTNIFETNIINLAVVIGVVVSFVGSNLTALLEDRKKTIVNNLQEANQRAIDAQEKLSQARAQLELAKKKAQEIREEGISRATQEINTVVSQHEIRLAKLDEFKEETLSFYQQKAFKEAYLYVISRIMTRVREKLNSGLDSTYHVVVNNFYVSRFTEYNPK